MDLRHIVQPYAAWSIVSTDNISLNDPRVDRLSPTTRPRPLDPVRFNAIDELQSWNVVRLGTRNRLLTRRDKGAFEWLFMDTYIDGFIEDPEEQRDLSNLYNEIRWQPLPWLSAGLETQFPLDQLRFGLQRIQHEPEFHAHRRISSSRSATWS